MKKTQIPIYKIALERIFKQALAYDFKTVIDIGAGDGFATQEFYKRGKEVTTTGFDLSSPGIKSLPQEIKVYENLDVCNMSVIPDRTYDAVWCSHVIEHVMNTQLALSEIKRILKPDGILFLIVPSYYPYIVGGHLCTGWNIGMLMYVLILNGFDVANGSFIEYHDNLCAFVRNGEDCNVELAYDKGDIERIKHLFPASLNISEGFDGRIKSHNWNWLVPPIEMLDEEREHKLSQTIKKTAFLFTPPIVKKTYYKLTNLVKK